MPHNLYLHSSIIQTRNFERSKEGKSIAIKWSTLDTNFSLLLACFVNACILIVASASFHNTKNSDISDLTTAYKLLAPTLGHAAASTLFAIALLGSGQNSTITGTIAGQIVMEGFVDLKVLPWVRRLITRGLAVVPAAIIVAVLGEQGVTPILLISQVILSMQLPFAVIPLVQFTSDPAKMGEFVNSARLMYVSWAIVALICVMNAFLIVQLIFF
jgi:manganese transport protein